MAVATPAKPVQAKSNSTNPTEALLTEFKGMKEALEKLSKPVYPDGANPAAVLGGNPDTVPATPKNKRAGVHFKSFGHQLDLCRKDKLGVLSEDEVKLIKDYKIKAALGMNEATGSDGGFLLEPQFVDGILEIAHEENTLLSLCDKYEMTSPSMRIRAVDETSRVNGSRRGGVQGYWVDEAGALTPSKPKFRIIELVPHKLAVLTYLTEELLQDGPMVEQFVSRFAADELNFKVGDAIVNGTGAGMPLGILNAAATVQVSKETGQAIGVQTENMVKMFYRLHKSGRDSAVWLINQDVGPYMALMTLGIGAAGVTTYMPPGGISGKGYATLMGRPVIEIEFAQTAGTVGDIILADMKQYIVATRGGVMATDSVHVAFLTDEVAYKFTWRVAGMPWWNGALTPYKGTATQSPFITLAVRP